MSDEIDIEDIGTYPANVVRRIDSDVVAVRFTITEALAVRMAARIAAVYVETHVPLIRAEAKYDRRRDIRRRILPQNLSVSNTEPVVSALPILRMSKVESDAEGKLYKPVPTGE